MTLTASCHCGATKIEAKGLPAEIKECNCTYCHRTGAVWGYYAPEDLKVTASDADRDYAPSGMNHHHFCGKCGGNTHGFSPDWASMYENDGSLKPGMSPGVPERQLAAINLRMVDDLDLTTLTVIKVDGRNSW